MLSELGTLSVKCRQHPVKILSEWDQTRSSSDADKPARHTYRSTKVTIPYVRYSFHLCNSNFVFKTRHFSDIRLQKCRDLEIRVRGPSRSLEIAPYDRAHTTSYWRSIVTMALSCVVSEIFNVEKMSWPWNRVRCHSRSLKVVPFNRLGNWVRFPISVH